MQQLKYRIQTEEGGCKLDNYIQSLGLYIQSAGLHIQTLLIIILLSTPISPGRIQKPPPAFQQLFLSQIHPEKEQTIPT